MSERKPCPVEGCTATVSRSLLMCKHHWFSVPGRLRREVLRNWDIYQTSKKPDERLIAVRAWKDAARAAIAAGGERQHARTA